MKLNCSACGAKNKKSNSECQYCGESLIAPSRKASNDLSDSLLNRGIALYKSGNYDKAEEVFLEVLEKNQNDFIASMYLSFVVNENNFSILKEYIIETLKSTNSVDHKNTIYQGVLAHIASWLKPEIERIGFKESEIRYDTLAQRLTKEDAPIFLSDLKGIYVLIGSFPQNYLQQFLKILIRRYQYPWLRTYWIPYYRPLNELVLINDLGLLLRQNMEETRILFSTISDLHIEVIKQYLEKQKEEDSEMMQKLYRQGIIDWNEKINNFFESSDFTESELGFSHSVKIEPYLPELNKILVSNSENSDAKVDKSGCFIATAAMGDYNHSVVVDLRQFRDEWLLKRAWGISFTKWYYTHGPKAANLIERSSIFKKLTYFVVLKPLQLITRNFLS
jgi:hypothetical protein